MKYVCFLRSTDPSNRAPADFKRLDFEVVAEVPRVGRRDEPCSGGCSLSTEFRGGQGESQVHGGERAGWPGRRQSASCRRVGGAGSLPQTQGCLHAQEILACEGGRAALRPTGTAASRHTRPVAKLTPRACRPQGPSTSCAPAPSGSQVVLALSYPNPAPIPHPYPPDW